MSDKEFPTMEAMLEQIKEGGFAGRLLMPGTTFAFGDKTVRLDSPAIVVIDNGQLSDDGFAGLLAVSGRDNFLLNIPQLAPKKYNSATGARVPEDCNGCGKAVADGVEFCDDCLSLQAADAARAAAESETVEEAAAEVAEEAAAPVPTGPAGAPATEVCALCGGTYPVPALLNHTMVECERVAAERLNNPPA